jgi:hypothetical protein
LQAKQGLFQLQKITNQQFLAGRHTVSDQFLQRLDFTDNNPFFSALFSAFFSAFFSTLFSALFSALFEQAIRDRSWFDLCWKNALHDSVHVFNAPMLIHTNDVNSESFEPGF